MLSTSSTLSRSWSFRPRQSSPARTSRAPALKTGMPLAPCHKSPSLSSKHECMLGGLKFFAITADQRPHAVYDGRCNMQAARGGMSVDATADLRDRDGRPCQESTAALHPVAAAQHTGHQRAPAFQAWRPPVHPWRSNTRAQLPGSAAGATTSLNGHSAADLP